MQLKNDMFINYCMERSIRNNNDCRLKKTYSFSFS